MKKEKVEKIQNSLSEYLKKRNYEAFCSTSEVSEKEVGMLGLLESSTPNSLSYSSPAASALHMEHQFARLKAWMMEASEPCRSELSQLLFPLFVHIYLELGSSATKSAANSFFNKNFSVFRVNREYEQTLRQLVSNSGDVSQTVVRCLRSGKYQIRVSDSSTLQYLLRYLRSSNNPTILQILSRYIDVESDDGLVPSILFSEVEQIEDKAGASTASARDCSAEQLAAVEAVIANTRQLPHPGLSVALYSVLNAHNGVCCASTSPAVDILACGFEDSVVKVWSLTPHWSHLTQQNKVITFLSCDETRIDEPVNEDAGAADEASASTATSSTTTSGRSRKQASGGEVLSLRGHSGPVFDMDFTSTASHLVTVSEDTYMRLWDLSDGECVAKYSGHNYPVFRVANSPGDFHVATGSADLSARLWNLEYLHPLRVFAGHTASVNALAFHPNCGYLATGSWDHSVRLWQVTDASAVRILLHHSAPVSSLAFSPHGRLLASGSSDGSVCVWDLSVGKVLADIGYPAASDAGASATNCESIVELSWSQDSQLLVVASMDGLVRTISLSPDTGDGCMEANEVHSVWCGADATLLHATLTQHNYIAAVAVQRPDR
ncbi:TFIID subunit TAF5 NTD2 domain [Trinorchestia longiramus]|nr:TFIID subunit TAF5 NTD2 domain [Trinorchestia longiramus]